MKNEFEISLEWLRFFSGASGIISLLGLMISLVQTAQAQGEPRGKVPPEFLPGKRNLTSPFAGKPKRPSNVRNRGAKKITVQKPGAPKGKDVPEPKVTSSGIQVGGSPPAGVKQGTALDPLKVDSETGIGSDAVITDFNYPDADILDIARTIGKLTGKNFIFDKNVKGRISIVSNSPITVGDAWRAFLTALDINNYTLIPSGEYIRIARQRDARDKQLNTYTGEYSPNTDALITRVFPLKFISADEVARTFRSFMPANSRIIPYAQTNTVIVTDTGSNIKKLSKMLEFLDIEGFDAGIEVIPVVEASAVEIAKLIDTLLPGTTTRSTGSSKRRNRNRGSQFQARRTKEGGIVNNIIADERTNSLIVHANKKGTQEVRKLVKKLDRKVPPTQGGGKIHVVYLQFADAEEVAKTLNALGSGSSTRSTRRRRSSSSRSSSQGNPVRAGSLFEGAIKVSADKATNSIVVTASGSDFSTIERVLKKLDIPRDEVFAEVVIMEMTLGKDFNFSANLALPSQGIQFAPNQDLANFLTNPVTQRGLVLGFKRGNTVEIDLPDGTKREVNEVTGLIKALQTNNMANVLATPTILTLDNVEAKFETNERIPVPTSNITQTGQSVSVSKESVGLSISIKPQINKISNFVKMELKAKLEDITGRDLPSQVQDIAFATLERKAETTVVVADNDTVVLGGLIRDKESKTVAKIPILGDIPLLGWLFSSRRTEIVKTNLLIFITPHIIRNYKKLRALLDESLQKRDDFIERFAGGDDALRDYRDDLIRRLPDINDVLNKKPQVDANLLNSQSQDDEFLDASDAEEEDDGEEFIDDEPDPALAPEDEPDLFQEGPPLDDLGDEAKDE